MKKYEIYIYDWVIDKEDKNHQIRQKIMTKKAYTKIGLILKILYLVFLYDHIEYREVNG